MDGEGVKNKNYYNLCRKLLVFHMVLMFFSGTYYSIGICNANAEEIVLLTIIYITAIFTNIWAVMNIGELMCMEKEELES